MMVTMVAAFLLTLRKHLILWIKTYFLKKLEHYDITGISNKWLASYLSNRNQFVKINFFNSDIADNISWLPQSCLLVPLLYLVHINDLYSAIKCCKLHHFADDTNLMNFQASVKTFNKNMNHDLKKLIKFD